MTTQPERPQPLAGMRVLDVSQVMVGPYACMLLGDMGADVIKIEPPKGGDQTRGAMGFKMKGSDSMGFLNMNRNKRGVALNLKSEAGRALLFKLVEDADILVENYRPGVMKRLGISYEDCQKVNPRLVYVSISGFGQTGPWANRPGFDHNGSRRRFAEHSRRVGRGRDQPWPRHLLLAAGTMLGATRRRPCSTA